MHTHDHSQPFQPPRVLITAGGTREPVDDVRYIGNRSSGSLGLAIAQAASDLGWPTTLALSKSVHTPNMDAVTVLRFESTADLDALLRQQASDADIVIMAAAVADFTPSMRYEGKMSRSASTTLSIELVPTPDLLAALAARARPEQLLVGFALEPRDRMRTSAERKLRDKGVDIVVANPLETMESGSIEPTIIARPAFTEAMSRSPVQSSKAEFAQWLIGVLPEALRVKRATSNNSEQHP